MAYLDQFRANNPAFNDYSDDEVAGFVYQEKFAGAGYSRAEFDEFFYGSKQGESKSGIGLQDFAAGVVAGAPKLVGGVLGLPAAAHDTAVVAGEAATGNRYQNDGGIVVKASRYAADKLNELGNYLGDSLHTDEYTRVNKQFAATPDKGNAFSLADWQNGNNVADMTDTLAHLGKNPTQVAGMIGESLPSLVAPIVAARAAAANGLNATRAAIATGAGLEGSSAAADARDRVMKLPEEVLAKDEVYQAFLEAGYAPELAREAVALRAGGVAFPIGAGVSAVSSKLLGAGKFEADIGTGALGAGKMLGAGRGLVTETPQEFVESGASAYAANEGVKQFGNEQQSRSEGVLKQATQGAVAGGIAGAGMGLVSAPKGQPSNLDYANATPEQVWGNQPMPTVAPDARPDIAGNEGIDLTGNQSNQAPIAQDNNKAQAKAEEANIDAALKQTIQSAQERANQQLSGLMPQDPELQAMAANGVPVVEIAPESNNVPTNMGQSQNYPPLDAKLPDIASVQSSNDQANTVNSNNDLANVGDTNVVESQEAIKPEIKLLGGNTPFKTVKSAELGQTFKTTPNARVVPVEGGYGVVDGKAWDDYEAAMLPQPEDTAYGRLEQQRIQANNMAKPTPTVPEVDVEAAYRQREAELERQKQIDYAEAQVQAAEQEYQNILKLQSETPIENTALRKQLASKLMDAEIKRLMEIENRQQIMESGNPRLVEAGIEEMQGVPTPELPMPITPELEPTAQINLPENFTDERLANDAYRVALGDVMDQSMTGGGIALIPQQGTGYTGGDGNEYGQQVTRTKSMNHPITQALIADGYKADEVRNALDAALKGQKLGKRWQGLVTKALDYSGADAADIQAQMAEFEQNKAAELDGLGYGDTINAPFAPDNAQPVSLNEQAAPRGGTIVFEKSNDYRVGENEELPITAREVGGVSPYARAGDLQQQNRVREQLSFDLLPASEEDAVSQVADNFSVEVKQVATGAIKHGVDTVNSAQDAAHILAPQRKQAQEELTVLVLDANNKPIRVIKHSKGNNSEASFYPATMLASIVNTPNAASVWVSHNHPSGTVAPSPADKQVQAELFKQFSVSNIKINGHIITPSNSSKFVLLSEDGSHEAVFDIKPLARNKSIPTVERVIRKNSVDNGKKINSQEVAVNTVKTISAPNALVLLNRQNTPIGSLSLSIKEVESLKVSGFPDRLLRAIDRTNASKVLIKVEDKNERAGVNVIRMLNNIPEIGVLDMITHEGGERYRSQYRLVEEEKNNKNKVFYSFAGRNAKTANLDNLANAEARIAAGEDKDVVRQEAGWHKGVDGKWRFEIDDSKAKLIKEPALYSTESLKNIISHDALYEAYPSLRYVSVRLSDSGFGAAYSSDTNTIFLGGWLPVSEYKSALLHEIQHAIQKEEGFANGGNVSEFKNYKKREVARVDRQLNKVATGSEQQKELLDYRRKIKADLRTDQELYESLAGETEARNTQARMDMNAQERKLTAPWTTQDVADDKQIVRFGGGRAEFAPSKPMATEAEIKAELSNDVSTKRLLANGKLNVVQSVDDLPAMIAEQVKRSVASGAESVESFARSIKEKYNLEKFSLFESNGVIKLASFVVGKDSRNNGVGTRVMNDLVAFAEMQGKPIVLNAAVSSDGMGTTSRARLVKFYKRFGFVENKGKNKDYSISEEMVKGVSVKYSESGQVQGLFDPATGKSYLIADNLKAKDALGVATHEVGVHAWLDNADAKVKSELEARALTLVSDMQKSPSKTIKSLGERVAQRLDDAGETSGEEALAYTVETVLNEFNAERYKLSDSGILNLVGNVGGKYGTKVANFISDVLHAFRAAMAKAGWLRTGALTAADFVAVAKSNMRELAQNDAGVNDGMVTDNMAGALASFASDKPTAQEIEAARIELDKQLAIADKLEAEYGYLPAPNGERSNLNRLQWAQVRTPQFKAWFGDWDTVNNLEWLDSAEPVASMKGDEVPHFEKVKPLADWIGERWESATGGQVERADLGVISVDRKAASNSAGHGFGAVKTQAFYLVPEALKQGRLLGKLPEVKGKPEAFIVAAPIGIGEKTYRLLMEVRRDANMQRLYVHEAVLRDNVAIDGFVSAAEHSDGIKPHSPHKGYIYNFMLGLREKQAQGASKVVDANGEPMVVYHGTGADFDEFRTKNRKATVALSDGETIDYVQEYGGIYGEGAYFIDRSEYASAHAYNGSIIPAYLNLKNPQDAKSYKRQTRKTKEKHGFDGVSMGGEYIAFHPNQIKSAIGNVGTFSTKTGNINFSKQSNQPSNIAPTFTVPEFGLLGKAQQKLQNNFNRIQQIQEAIVKQGGKIDATSDVYKTEERFWGKVGSKAERFTTEMKQLVTSIADANITLEDMENFLYARHAIERNAFIRTNVDVNNDSGSGMTDKEASTIMADMIVKHPTILSFANQFDDMTMATRKMQLEAGLISKQTFDAWNEYRHYVPLKGWADAENNPMTEFEASRTPAKKGFDVRGAESKSAKGRKTLAEALIENMYQQRLGAIVRAGQNDIGAALFNLVNDNPNADLWEINAIKTNKVKGKTDLVMRFATEQERDDWINASGFNGVQAGQIGGVFTATVKDASVMQTKGVIDKDNTLALKVGGREVYIKIKDASLLEQMRQAGVSSEVHPIIKPVYVTQNWLKRFYTSLNPEFSVINFARDLLTAFVSMPRDTGNYLDSVKFLGNLKVASEAMKYAWRKDGKKITPLMQRYLDNGGTTGFMDFQSVESITTKIDDMWLRARKAKDAGMKDKARTYGNMAWSATLGAVEKMNEGLEVTTRLAAFKTAIDAGKTDAEAASIAKNITVNFNRKGDWAKQLDLPMMFFNPAIQGTKRVAELMSNSKSRNMLMGLVALGFMTVLMAGDEEDEAGNKKWDIISDERKMKTLPFGLSGDSFATVQMPYGVNFFTNMGFALADVKRWYDSDGKHGKSPEEAAEFTLKSMALHLNSFGGLQIFEGGLTSLQAVMPAVIDPIIQVGDNKSWAGKKLRPEQFDAAKEAMTPDSQKFYAGQEDNVETRIAGWLSRVTGGDGVQKGAIELAPSTINVTMSAVFGGLWSVGKATATTANKAIDPNQEVEAKDIPVVRKMVSGLSAGDYSAAYREKSDKIKAAMGAYDAYIKDGQFDKAQDYYRENLYLIEDSTKVKAYDKELKSLRTQRNLVFAQKSLSDDQRKTLLEQNKKQTEQVLMRALKGVE